MTHPAARDFASDSRVRAARAAAVEQFIARAKASAATRADGTPDPEATANELIALGRESWLFPFEHFPVEPDRVTPFYRLAEDGDGGFALYAAVGLPGKHQLPHDHTTWAVIAGVRGVERNVVYRRVNAENAAIAALEELRTVDITAGTAVILTGDDIHTTALLGDQPSLHLHFYGLSQERMVERVRFDGPHGGAVTPVPVSTAIRHAAIDVPTLRARLALNEELAVFDVREEGRYARGHLLEAANLPVSRIEVQVLARVPRRHTPIVLVDEAGEIVDEAAAKLLRIGYPDVAVLRGGTRAWIEAGEDVTGGVYVQGKLAAERAAASIEHTELSVAQFLELQQRTQPLLLDVRPFDEFVEYTIPGALNCPAGELPVRVPAFLRDTATPVVVHCAGRARSIRAAQILGELGLANPIHILRNGTMAWELHGLTLERGRREALPVSFDETRFSLNGMRSSNTSIRVLSADELAAWEAPHAPRSTYRLDVRTPDEFAAGHLPGWQSAPGGQLLHAVDRYAPTLHARIVLADWDGVRAPAIARRLSESEYADVALFRPPWDAVLAIGAEPIRVAPVSEVQAPRLEAAPLSALLANGRAVLFDVDSSKAFRHRHVRGARFGTADVVLETLAREAKSATDTRTWVITSADGLLAQAVASELRRKSGRDVRALLGGNAAAFAAGLETESGEDGLLNADDAWHGPHGIGDLDARLNAFREYIEWETALLQRHAR